MRTSRNAVSTVVSIFLLGCAQVAAHPLGSSSSRQAPTRFGKRHEVNTQRNSLDRLASRYMLLALRAWKLDPLPREMYGIFSKAPEAVEAEAKAMPAPTIDGLRAEISELQKALSVVRGSKTRREWLSQHLKAIDARLRLLSGEPLSLREEARLLFDLDVEPIPLERLKASRAELDRLLPGQGSLNQRLSAWINSTLIPTDKIEIAVRLTLAESRRRTLQVLTLPRGERVTLRFERGVPYGGWAEARGGSHTVLHVNVERPMTLGWLTHFIAHEGYPGHHVALTLLERTAKRSPEMRILPPLSPTNTLLEGGADAIAPAIWPANDLIEWMSRVLLPAIGKTQVDLALWHSIQSNVDTTYSAVLTVPFLLDEGASPEAAVRFLEDYGLTDRARAEAIVADVRDSPFPASFSLINAKHSPAAKILGAYLGGGRLALRRYGKLWSARLTPSAIARGR